VTSGPFVLAQLSDPHIGADWAGGDPTAAFAAAIETVRAMPVRPDAVLLSGDLCEHATDPEYEEVRDLVGLLGLPVHVLAGNHDDRAALRRHFDLPGTPGEPVQYSVDLGPIRLAVVDTTIPGEIPGALDAERLGWLDAELAASPAVPTVVAMHHPAHTTGIAAWDDFGLAHAAQKEFAEVVARHPQVRRIVAGHFHRTVTADVAGRPAVIVPSTYAQLRLAFDGSAEFVHEPPGFALHAMVNGDLVSYVQPVLS
jgi:3',5'-cyclic AMP phosphodiesterase CpdA